MKIENDDLIFDNGTMVYANRGIVGIDSELFLYGGYDDGIDDDELTKDEKLELADFMLNLWGKYKEKIV